MKIIYGIIYRDEFFPSDLNELLIDQYLDATLKRDKACTLYNRSGEWGLANSYDVIFVDDKTKYPEYFI